MTARIAGYVSRKEWGALPPKATTPLNGRRMLGVAVHHGGAGGYGDHAKCATQVRAYQRMHLAGDRGPQNDIAYNMLVCRHGYVFEGRTLLLQGGANGTSTANRTYFSVCVLGDGDVAFSQLVTDAIEWVIHQARTKHNAGDLVKRHRDFVSTTCPGSRLSVWAPTISGKPISTVPATDPSRPRLGDRGEIVATVQALLVRWGYTLDCDGVFGPKTDEAVRSFQRQHALEVDGIVGPATMAALNKPVPLPKPDPPKKEEPMPVISPEDWSRMTTSPEYARYKNRLADDPETAPRIPLGQAVENATQAALETREEIAGLRVQLDDIRAELAKIAGYVSGVSEEA